MISRQPSDIAAIPAIAPVAPVAPVTGKPAYGSASAPASAPVAPAASSGSGAPATDAYDHAAVPAAHRQPVRFEFTHPTAKTVHIAGSFNNWQGEGTPMRPIGNGRWVKETGLAPGDYEYRMLVDGVWASDPHALRTVPNPFGGSNSLLTVPSSTETPHLAASEHAPLKSQSGRKA